MLDDSEEHRPYEDYAVRHVMGSLDESESGAFRSHLLDCTECRARVGELRSIASDLAEVERSERRERAAQQVETKQREDDEAFVPEFYDEPRRRSVTVAAVAGISLIVILSVWNFVLRAQAGDLEQSTTALSESAETINFGDPWETDIVAPGHEGVARVDGRRFAVMLRGTDDSAMYRIVFFDAAGTRVGPADPKIESRDGTVRWFTSNLPANYDRVQISLDRSPNETVVFRADVR